MAIGLSEISLQVLFNYWAHLEFTSTQGVQHFHCLAKLPHVLDTEFIGHMTQNGRVVRQELKCGNIKPGNEQEAWDIVELGLLANRYATLFADSISMASFYQERMDVYSHHASKMIDVDELVSSSSETTLMAM